MNTPSSMLRAVIPLNWRGIQLHFKFQTVAQRRRNQDWPFGFFSPPRYSKSTICSKGKNSKFLIYGTWWANVRRLIREDIKMYSKQKVTMHLDNKNQLNPWWQGTIWYVLLRSPNKVYYFHSDSGFQGQKFLTNSNDHFLSWSDVISIIHLFVFDLLSDKINFKL